VPTHHINIHPLPPEWGCRTHIRRYRCSHNYGTFLSEFSETGSAAVSSWWPVH